MAGVVSSWSGSRHFLARVRKMRIINANVGNFGHVVGLMVGDVTTVTTKSILTRERMVLDFRVASRFIPTAMVGHYQ